MPKVAVYVKLAAAPGKGKELVDAFDSLYQGPLDEEEGTLVHVIHQGKDDPDTVFFYEMYSDDDALATHQRGEALKAVFPKLAGLVVAPPETVLGIPANAKGLTV